MILLALGSNLPSHAGTPQQTLAAALHELDNSGIACERCSRVWLTAPVPVSDQNWFHNMVVSVQTTVSAVSLLGRLHEVEASFGRVRRVKNEARSLDLDLLAYHDEATSADSSAGLIIPHPRLQERAFVLYPLKDIAPDWIHPVSGLSVSQMIKALPPGQQIKPL